MRFQNGCNKVAIELRVVQFWSEIILVISNDFEITCKVSSQIALHSVQLLLLIRFDEGLALIYLNLSTHLIKPNFCFSLPNRRSTTASLETNPFIHSKMQGKKERQILHWKFRSNACQRETASLN